MAAPNEGTTTLPSDAGSRYHWGLWKPSASAYYAPRAHDTREIITLGAYTGTATAAVQNAYDARAAIIHLHVTAFTSGTITPRVTWQDYYNGAVDILDIATAISATGDYYYMICPGGDRTASGIETGGTGFDKILPLAVPDELYIYVTKSNTSSWTFGVALTLLR